MAHREHSGTRGKPDSRSQRVCGGNTDPLTSGATFRVRGRFVDLVFPTIILRDPDFEMSDILLSVFYNLTRGFYIAHVTNI